MTLLTSSFKPFLLQPIAWSSFLLTLHASTLLPLFTAPLKTTCPNYTRQATSHTSRFSFLSKTITHTHDISFALQIYQEYSTDITTLLSCQSSKSIRVRITRLSQPTSNSLKHLTWGCLLAAQPQSLSVGVTISLLLSLRDYAWFWRMIIACLPVCSPPPCPDGGDEGG